MYHPSRSGHDFGYWFTFSFMLLVFVWGTVSLFLAGGYLMGILVGGCTLVWLKMERDAYRAIRESERELDRVEQLWRDAGGEWEELADEIHAWRERL